MSVQKSLGTFEDAREWLLRSVDEEVGLGQAKYKPTVLGLNKLLTAFLKRFDDKYSAIDIVAEVGRVKIQNTTHVNRPEYRYVDPELLRQDLLKRKAEDFFRRYIVKLSKFTIKVSYAQSGSLQKIFIPEQTGREAILKFMINR